MLELRIPQAGESITEVQVGEWLKAEGDPVRRDEVVVEIETDKASMDLPAPGDGTISRILKKQGEMASVGDVIALIEETGAGAAAAAGATKVEPKVKPAPAPEPRPKAKPQPAAQAPSATPQPGPTKGAAPAPAPAARSTTEPGTAPAAAVEHARPEDKQEQQEKGVPELPGAPRIEVHPRVMPSARRALAEHGLTAEEVRGTGPGGRILKEDVLRHVDRARQRQITQQPVDNREEEAVSMSLLRRRIAERLVQAQHTAALLTTFNEVDMTAVSTTRRQYGDAFQKKHGVKLGFMSFFIKASIDALRLFPQINAEIRENQIVYRKYYDIGVAVGTEKGLVVPVLRNAERMSFAAIEQAIADMAVRAREGKLKVEELQGGTFTISNGGVYGSLLSTPIVNPPQSGILGLHAIQDRPVARDGQVVIRPMMYLALTYDHRIVDGREAVTFLRHIKEVIEDPARLLLDV